MASVDITMISVEFWMALAALIAVVVAIIVASIAMAKANRNAEDISTLRAQL